MRALPFWTKRALRITAAFTAKRSRTLLQTQNYNSVYIKEILNKIPHTYWFKHRFNHLSINVKLHLPNKITLDLSGT